MLFFRPLRLAHFFAAILLATPGFAQPGPEAFDPVLTALHETNQLNGVVLVAEGDSVLYERGFGEANMAWGVPNAPDTRFRIGSVTKQFTAAVILQLAEEGFLELDVPITTYLPDYPAVQGDRITIHHLLTHTSGIPSYTSLPTFFADISRDPYEPDSFFTVFADLPLEFEPGTLWTYSNSGYFVLGAIVEAVTGRSFGEALRVRLLDPLDLEDSGYDHYRDVLARRATGYVFTGSHYERAPYLDTSIPYAAGMMYSTARDLHAWNRALYDGVVFERPETLMRMLTPYANDYGYGVSIRDTDVGERAVSMIRHGGGINGFSSQLWYMPDEGYTIVVLDNTSSSTSTVADAVARVLYDQPQRRPTPSIATEIGPIIEESGVSAAVNRYRELREEEREAYDFGEEELNGLGYFYLRRGDLDTAIRLFEVNVETHPEASNPYDSLGEAYMEAGDQERAIENYERSLELNPGNENARQMLRRMGVEAGPPQVDVSTDVLESYTGRYELQPGFAITVTREGDQLYAQATGQPRFEIYPSAEDEFYLTVVDAQISFNADEGGAVESLTLRQSGQQQTAPKVR